MYIKLSSSDYFFHKNMLQNIKNLIYLHRFLKIKQIN